MFKNVGSALLFATGAQASYHWGGCPSFTDMGDSFNKSNYMGRWYEVSRDMYMQFSIGTACVNVDYTLRDDGSIRVHNKAVYPYWGWYGKEGSAVPSEVDGPAGLVVNLNGDPDPSKEANYHVIDTDYVSYVIIYSCEELFYGWYA